jgi:hypothetical protein
MGQGRQRVADFVDAGLRRCAEGTAATEVPRRAEPQVGPLNRRRGSTSG